MSQNYLTPVTEFPFFHSFVYLIELSRCLRTYNHFHSLSLLPVFLFVRILWRKRVNTQYFCHLSFYSIGRVPAIVFFVSATAVDLFDLIEGAVHDSNFFRREAFEFIITSLKGMSQSLLSLVNGPKRAAKLPNYFPLTSVIFTSARLMTWPITVFVVSIEQWFPVGSNEIC